MSIALRLAHVTLAALLFASPIEMANAAPMSSEEATTLREEIARLRRLQAEQQAALDAANTRLQALELQIAAIGDGAPETAATTQHAQPVGPRPDQAVAASAPVERASSLLDGLDVGGDVRLRYEHNWAAEDARDRGRGVLRARLRASYAINDWLAVGGQIVTGDPDDPNTADISLANFADDLAFTLDQAYLRAKLGGAIIWGGKFGNPFARSDLVWDGDVSPQGLAITYEAPLGTGVGLRLAGLYFLVDESVAGPNSEMVGGQAELMLQPAPDWKVRLSGAYYDYSLRSLAGGDAGDFRSNLRHPDGRYLSDFDLVDGIVSLDYLALGRNWPLQISGEYVRNLGAATDADSGYTIGISLGQASRMSGWKVSYNYMVAETDAVLAAFSHDNIDLATNYLLHGVSVDHALTDDIIVNATVYRFRKKDALGPGATLAGDWRNRLRFNLLVNF